MLIIDLNMFNIVDKNCVLQQKFRNIKKTQYDKYNTNLYTYYT